MCPCLQAFEWVLEEWWIQTNAPSELSRHLSGDITACIRPGVGHPPMFCCDNQMSLKTQTGIIIMAFRTQGQHQECNGFVTVNRCHSYRQLCLLFTVFITNVSKPLPNEFCILSFWKYVEAPAPGLLKLRMPTLLVSMFGRQRWLLSHYCFFGLQV